MTLINSLISSSSFLVASLGLCMYSIMSSINSDSFTSFPVCIPSIYFSSLTGCNLYKSWFLPWVSGGGGLGKSKASVYFILY